MAHQSNPRKAFPGSVLDTITHGHSPSSMSLHQGQRNTSRGFVKNEAMVKIRVSVSRQTFEHVERLNGARQEQNVQGGERGLEASEQRSWCDLPWPCHFPSTEGAQRQIHVAVSPNNSCDANDNTSDASCFLLGEQHDEDHQCIVRIANPILIIHVFSHERPLSPPSQGFVKDT